MLAFSGERRDEAKKMMNFIQNREWGLMLLDEVQMVAAKTFRTIAQVVSAHCKLGLTATLVK